MPTIELHYYYNSLVRFLTCAVSMAAVPHSAIGSNSERSHLLHCCPRAPWSALTFCSLLGDLSETRAGSGRNASRSLGGTPRVPILDQVKLRYDSLEGAAILLSARLQSDSDKPLPEHQIRCSGYRSFSSALLLQLQSLTAVRKETTSSSMNYNF